MERDTERKRKSKGGVILWIRDYQVEFYDLEQCFNPNPFLCAPWRFDRNSWHAFCFRVWLRIHDPIANADANAIYWSFLSFVQEGLVFAKSSGVSANSKSGLPCVLWLECWLERSRQTGIVKKNKTCLCAYVCVCRHGFEVVFRCSWCVTRSL